MSWPWRAVLGPAIWALAFAAIYAAHGLGCAWGWPSRPGLIGNQHQFTLILLWLFALVLGGLVLWSSPRGAGRGLEIARAGAWIGLVATALTLFPVLGLSTCTDGVVTSAAVAAPQE